MGRWAEAQLLVQVRNRRYLLAMGRTALRAKIARLDPALLPDDALNRLIQRYPSSDLVERLRAERDRRATLKPSRPADRLHA